MNGKSTTKEGTQQHSGLSGSPGREQDVIYQKGKPVAKVVGAEVNLEAKEITFGEVLESDHLLLPDECEFQKYRIIIQKVAFATKIDRRPGHHGRTLAGCTAEILGYIEQ